MYRQVVWIQDLEQMRRKKLASILSLSSILLIPLRLLDTKVLQQGLTSSLHEQVTLSKLFIGCNYLFQFL